MPTLQIPSYFSTKVVSRTALYDDGENEEFTKDDELLELLNKAVTSSIEVNTEESRKRRKVEANAQQPEEDHIVLFRLVSNTEAPQPISLKRPPPRPSIPKVVDAEDDKATAKKRHKMAKASAVDSSWVLKEASQGRSTPPDLRCKLGKPVASDTNLLVVSRLAAPRTTRPSGIPSETLVYPYTTKTPSEEATKVKCCPVVEQDQNGPRPSRSRRKRSYERPPPSFWRPAPSLKGKCVGYAYGYPSSFGSVEGWDERGILYRRDSVKNITQR
ncbi:hypothetical protein FA15DRAFT_624286 [Coprinopsis marcescibilis]|uniref:Uncharacterized protein n=1 Tax=Coprinopsis marcescibilis TaxID=230819 RepID=A0A5C3KLD6_COPMA|nr:hypothetical protein FA15DRAFT_624286 [Coprinopsis marcescibilis]